MNFLKRNRLLCERELSQYSRCIILPLIVITGITRDIQNDNTYVSSGFQIRIEDDTRYILYFRTSTVVSRRLPVPRSARWFAMTIFHRSSLAVSMIKFSKLSSATNFFNRVYYSLNEK